MSAAANNGFRYPPTQMKTPDPTTPTTANAATIDSMSLRPGLLRRQPRHCDAPRTLQAQRHRDAVESLC